MAVVPPALVVRVAALTVPAMVVVLVLFNAILVKALPAPTLPSKLMLPAPALMVSARGVPSELMVSLKLTSPVSVNVISLLSVVALLNVKELPLPEILAARLMPPAALTVRLVTGVVPPITAFIEAMPPVVKTKLLATSIVPVTVMPPELVPLPMVTKPLVEMVPSSALVRASMPAASAAPVPNLICAESVLGRKVTAPPVALVEPVNVMLSAR